MGEGLLLSILNAILNKLNMFQEELRNLQVRGIEEHLNRLCSQHDELMSLLDICQYIPSVRGLQQFNQQLSQKISLSEKQALAILPVQDASKEVDQENVKAKYEAYLLSLKKVKQSLSQTTEELNKTSLQISALRVGHRSKEKDLKLQAGRVQMKDSIEKMEKKAIQEIAHYHSKMNKKKANQDPQNNLKAIIISEESNFNLEKLEHQIELEKISFEPPPLEDFCIFTCGRLKRDIEKMKRGLLLMDNDIRFQIEGLKQFVVESLLLKYSQKGCEEQTRNLENRVRLMIDKLEILLMEAESGTNPINNLIA